MKHRDNLLWTFPRATIVVLLLLFCTINTTPAQTTLSAEDIAEKALAATVYLEMQDKSGKTLGIGSGFFVQPNLIATNYHVIEGAAKGTAKLVGKYTTYNIEGFTATDQKNDLAILKVTTYGIKPLPSVIALSFELVRRCMLQVTRKVWKARFRMVLSVAAEIRTRKNDSR